MADELSVLSDLTAAMDRLDADGQRRAVAYLTDRYGEAKPDFGFTSPLLITERADAVYAPHEVDLRGPR